MIPWALWVLELAELEDLRSEDEGCRYSMVVVDIRLGTREGEIGG